MAESLDMHEQAMLQRIANAMQHWERSAELQIAEFHTRLDTLLVTEMGWQMEGRSDELLQEDWNHPGRYFGMRQDSEIGPEMYSGDAARIADLHARLDAMGQAQQHEPQHDQGMEP